MKNKVKGLLLRLPVIIIFLIIVVASFYLKITNFPINGMPIAWFTPITLTLVFLLYLWGEYLSLKQTNSGNYSYPI